MTKLTRPLRPRLKSRAEVPMYGGSLFGELAPHHRTRLDRYFASGKRKLPASRRAAYLRQAYRIARRTRGVRQLVQYQLLQTLGRSGTPACSSPTAGRRTPSSR